MEQFGAYTFWLMMSGTFVLIAGYAMWRMTRRAAMPSDETESYVNVLPSASAIAVQAAVEWSAEQAESEREG